MEANNNCSTIDKLKKYYNYIFYWKKKNSLNIIITLIFIYFVSYVREISIWVVKSNTLIESLTLYSTKTVFLKLLTFLIITYISVKYINHTYQSKSTWVRMLFHAYAWIIIFVSSASSWTIISCGMSYQPFFYFVTLSSLTIDLAFVIDGLLKGDNEENVQQIAGLDINNYSGFVVTTKPKDYEKTGNEDLSKILLARLYNTNVSAESYAVGIVGEWGSGKTTFLNHIKAQIQDEYIIFEFNPWDIKSPGRIVSEFFNSFAELFDDEDKDTKKLILDYLGILNSVVEIPYTEKIKEFLNIDSNESLHCKKRSIISNLKESRKKYLVCIDDIDRLDGVELFEVLRLIRNTANFPSLYFIVTYDKKYVVDRLTRIGLDNSEQYLKKIFNTEIVLPSYEHYVIPRLFLKDLFSMLHDENIRKALIREVSRTGMFNKYIITDYIQNFRDSKRFANILSLHIDRFLFSHKLNEISLHDFFWIEVLAYYDAIVYELLRTKRFSMLDYNEKNNGVYILKENYETKLVTDGVNLKPGTKFILNELFNKEGSDNYDACIKNRANYNNYFSYRILDTAIGVEEFDRALICDSKSEVILYVMRWCEENKRRKMNSLVERLEAYEPLIHYERENRNYMQMLVSSVKYIGYRIISLFSIKLVQENFEEEKIEELSLFLKDIISEEITITNDRPFWNRLLASMHTEIQVYDDEGSYKHRTILGNDTLSELSSTNFRLFLSSKNLPDPVEIANGKSELGRFVRESVIISQVDEAIVDENRYEGTYRESLIDRELIGTYRGYNSKKLAEFISNFDFTDDYCTQPPEEIIKYDIECVFGTISSYKEFIEASFVRDDSYIDAYYKRIHI